MIVNIVKAETAGKLKLTGGAYLLEKKTDSETWEVKHGRAPVEEKELTVSNFEEKFPKVKADSGVSVGEMADSNYWGFMKDKGDLAKICDSTSCSETAQATNIGPEVFE